MRSLTSLDESQLWRELGTRQHSDARQLYANVEVITKNAEWIGRQIVRTMPQYTLHDDNHFLNVLAIMEQLLPANKLDTLAPLEIGMMILAAYLHDLGMALTDREHVDLQDPSTARGNEYADFRTRFLARMNFHSFETQYSSPTSGNFQQELDAQILASYLRETHVDSTRLNRLNNWLNEIKSATGNALIYHYGNYDFQRDLELLCLSHGQEPSWLRREHTRNRREDGFFRPVNGESVNFAFPGLLLRLADLMDFDASRTPEILFRNSGINDEKSLLEWRKHRSIVGWRLDRSSPRPELHYQSVCHHPLTHKAVRDFVFVIESELKGSHYELDMQRRNLPNEYREAYQLNLPHNIVADIQPAFDNSTGKPAYIFHDIQFRLDQDRVLTLLMGESLYGDSGLCIRELIQNSLDAIELRDIRLILKGTIHERHDVDGEAAGGGKVRHRDGTVEDLQVVVDWGIDGSTGLRWLRVSDNGIGMSEADIAKYFANIGSSYFRSPEFRNEQNAAAKLGHVISPSAIFGIGFLSCFMISDRIEVRTNPGAGAGQPLDISICGPGSFFWMKPGTLNNQGTEITLYLKTQKILLHNPLWFSRVLKESIDLWRGIEIRQLRSFGTKHDDLYQFKAFHEWPVLPEEGELHVIDPVLYAAAHVGWPRYPIYLRASKQPTGELLGAFLDDLKKRLTSRYGLSTDDPIVAYQLAEGKQHLAEDLQVFKQNSSDECIDANAPLTMRYRRLRGTEGKESFGANDITYDQISWIDSQSADATGSRISLWYPKLKGSGGKGLADSDIPTNAGVKQFELSRRLGLRNPSSSAEVFVCGFRVAKLDESHFHDVRSDHGCFVSIDLRGEACPRLKADRSQPVKQLRHTYASDHPIRELKQRFFEWLSNEFRNGDISEWRNLLHGFPFLRPYVPNQLKGRKQFNLLECCAARSKALEDLSQFAHEYLQSPPSSVAVVLRKRQLLEEVLASISSAATSQDFEILAQNILDYSLREKPRDARGNSSNVGPRRPPWCDMSSAFRATEVAETINHLFREDLRQSRAVMELFPAIGSIANGHLSAPGIVDFEYKKDGQTIRPRTSLGGPDYLAERKFDLCWPITAIPFRDMLLKCPEWNEIRWYRELAVSPFLKPELHDLWAANASKVRTIVDWPAVYCFVPVFELWEKPFDKWTDADWSRSDNLSTLWDISGSLTGVPGQILWARGCHDIAQMVSVGAATDQFEMDDGPPNCSTPA